MASYPNVPNQDLTYEKVIFSNANTSLPGGYSEVNTYDGTSETVPITEGINQFIRLDGSTTPYNMMLLAIGLHNLDTDSLVNYNKVMTAKQNGAGSRVMLYVRVYYLPDSPNTVQGLQVLYRSSASDSPVEIFKIGTLSGEASYLYLNAPPFSTAGWSAETYAVPLQISFTTTTGTVGIYFGFYNNTPTSGSVLDLKVRVSATFLKGRMSIDTRRYADLARPGRPFFLTSSTQDIVNAAVDQAMQAFEEQFDAAIDEAAGSIYTSVSKLFVSR